MRCKQIRTFGSEEASAVIRFADQIENEHVQQSLKVIEQTFAQFNYDSNQMCLSFNGGKDCTVLLHLLSAFIWQNKTNIKSVGQLLTLYIRLDDPFLEIEQFIQEAKEYYNLNLIVLTDVVDFKQSLQRFKESSEGQLVNAIFMGQRSTDNPCLKDFIAKTDAGWPEFVRVNPLLNWSYQQVWKFIRDLNVPYCLLYDQGYSSLGSRHNTQRNIKLIQVQSDGSIKYLAPELLSDSKFERLSRF